jgi:GGDEF domain-containing protein
MLGSIGASCYKAHVPAAPAPVPGLPTPALADGEAVAKAWIERLVAAAPIEQVGDVPVAQLAQDGPPLAATLVRALASDDELGLLAVLAANPALMAGATDVLSAIAAVAALRDATVQAVLDAVEGADAAWTARLALRAAHCCDRLLEAALQAPAAAPEPAPDPLEALAREVVDEGAPAWERLVARAVGRHLEDGQPFCVLAIEADGADRLAAADGGPQALERADRALCDTVRARDRVVSAGPGRWWAVVPDAGLEAGRALVRRAGEAIGAIVHAGAPLRVSAGLAVCPRDGAEPAELLGAAEERLLGALAGGELFED